MILFFLFSFLLQHWFEFIAWSLKKKREAILLCRQSSNIHLARGHDSVASRGRGKPEAAVIFGTVWGESQCARYLTAIKNQVISWKLNVQ